MDEELLDEFKEEAFEAIESAESSLLNIDKGEDFDTNYNNVFRVFHSLKGASGMFGLDDLQKHFHHLENLLSIAKTRNTVEPLLVDYFLKGLDCVKEYFGTGSIEFELIDPLADESNTKENLTVDKNKKESLIQKANSNGVVYIVDDEEDILDILEMMLQDSGFTVHKFTEATKALDQLKAHKPDAIISDVRMPEMNGVEFTRLAHEFDNEIPIIIYSGHLAKANIMELLQAGAYGVMEKPIDDPETFCNAVNNACKRHRAVRLIDRSIKFIMYQFSDISDLLQQQNKTELLDSLKTELSEIMLLRKSLKDNVFVTASSTTK